MHARKKKTNLKDLKKGENLVRNKNEEIVDLVESFPTRIWTSKSASIQRKTDRLKLEIEKWVSR